MLVRHATAGTPDLGRDHRKSDRSVISGLCSFALLYAAIVYAFFLQLGRKKKKKQYRKATVTEP